MSAALIDGAALAERIKNDVRARAAALGRPVHLTAILVGGTHAAELYANRQAEACRSVGIDYQLLKLPENITAHDLKTEIRRLNTDPAVTGIMMHLPLPPHLEAARMQYEIDVVKDVEGVNPANIGYVVYGKTLIAPCTALSVIELIKSTGVPIRGAEAVVVGASEIAGKPIALLLAEQMATITLCHIATTDLLHHTRHAEILISAVGKAGLIGAEQVREGAVVIDVGINRVTLPDGTKKTVGDVDFDAVRAKASHITPVPGGVGPMTVAMLLRNTLRSAEILAGTAKWFDMRSVAFILAAMMLACPALAAAPSATAPATAPARVDRFIGVATAVVIDADLSRVDVDGASQWLADIALASVAATEPEVANARAAIEITRRNAVEWSRKFLAAGGSHVIVTSEYEWLLEAGFALYAPLPPQAPSKPVEELFSGLHWGRRNSVAPVKTLDGNIVAFLGGASQALRTANRADFAAALADLPATAPLRVVIAPDKTFREKTPQQWPASASVLEATEWLAIAADPKPGGAIDVTLQGHGAAGAQSLFDRWTALVKRTFDPAEPRDGLKDVAAATVAKTLVAPLTPRLENARLRLSLPAAELPGLIRAARPAIRHAGRIRKRDRSAHNMTRLLVGLRGYAAKHSDWPFELRDVAPFLGAGELSTIWLNPAAERVNPGYVYVRPAVPIPPNDRAILYENRADGTPFGDWRLVGFADGRVEVVYDEARFDRLTGKG